MVGELDSIGAALTGALAGRAVEPQAGESKGHSHETHCLNCRSQLSGPFCSNCGQRAHVHRTIGAFFHDLLHGVLHFDGKTWRTLPMLAWRPGELTRRYIGGQRARFVSPLALFLFSVFVMFALLGSTVATPELSSPRITGDLDKAMTQTRHNIAILEARQKAPPGPGESRTKIAEKLAKQREELQGIEAMRSLAHDRSAKFDLPSELAWVQQPIERALRNPDLLVYKVRSSAYKWSWALIPISAPFLWLLFPFSRRFRMYDHVIFVTYSLAFMNIVAVAATLIYLAGLPSIASLAFFIPPIHFYRQLKEAYGLTRFGALWRTAAVTVFAVLGLGFFAMLMLVVGFF